MSEIIWTHIYLYSSFLPIYSIDKVIVFKLKYHGMCLLQSDVYARKNSSPTAAYVLQHYNSNNADVRTKAVLEPVFFFLRDVLLGITSFIVLQDFR